MERLHLIVSGRVQGVSFRAYTETRARALGLTGTVRNLPDRRVDIVAEGPRAGLEALLAFARKGSPFARVTDVQAIWEAATGGFTEFQILR